ncbi:indolepyruvate oxidoreductase [candidate division KSB3 bacterium]|uniref:Indolepyruvate oxidoreductase n=1 Tax=candidate division KSB3 bacterium TaxID=2044937 RepID=A0A2G6EA44_9BACT|nr:MAG: indolepyruvate oxidoreductase [candidate division KSB3 bacterium]PIE31006.1 MAG: indolepyruvate oxidoreductase [candidate division KSB3 bacterium]
MKNDIILAGVGGQGILSIAAIIGYAAVGSGLYLKQAEVHGMSQRGGAVQSHLRISDTQIYSDLIPGGSARLVLSVEPMESLRYLPYLSKEGWLITNTKSVINIKNYPGQDALYQKISELPRQIMLPADDIARDIGASRAMNMVMLGAGSPQIEVSYEQLQQGIRFIFSRKGEAVVTSNLKALDAGRVFAQERMS